MKLVIDSAIPYARPYAEQLGTCRFLPASEITADAVRDADALIIRTRTRCDASLLEGSKVQFIATATIGYDHLDSDYLRSRGIAWTNCPGCNAVAVRQYVEGCLRQFAEAGHVSLAPGTTIGIVGVGHVGSLVESLCRELGMRVLRCDPPREDRGEAGFCDLSTIAAESDVITFHVPLNEDGKYRTRHMADDSFFELVKASGRRPAFINCSRGEVVNTESLVRALDDGILRVTAIDTWEDEPHISLQLLQRAFIATPHIAGYSLEGKLRATQMSFAALRNHFGFNIVPPEVQLPPVPSPAAPYNPLLDTTQLRQNPSSFESLRSNYPLRREDFE